MTTKLATIEDLARWVSQEMTSENHLNRPTKVERRQQQGDHQKESADTTNQEDAYLAQQRANQVLMMITAIGKFMAFMFRKTHYETVIAEVFGIGTFIRNCSVGQIGETNFYPTSLLSKETLIAPKMPSVHKEPQQRQELTLERIAQFCSISEDVTLRLLTLISKAIVSGFWFFIQFKPQLC